MDSFISNFSKKIRSYLFLLSAMLPICFGVSVLYLMKGSPEINHWKKLYGRKHAWACQIRESGENKIIFAGGSSCAFAIRPDVFEEYGLNCVNMGGGAACGALFLTALAWKDIDPGDTLILAFEPEIFNLEKLNPTQPGIQSATVLHSPDLAVAGQLTGDQLAFRHWIGAMRPGGDHVVTMLFKLILKGICKRPLFAYAIDNADASGWLRGTYRYRGMGVDMIEEPPLLRTGAKKFLIQIKQKCDERGVRVAYSFPWCMTKKHCLDTNRLYFQQLGQQIAEILPVLDDPTWRSVSDPSLFSDTRYHLRPDGAEMRSRQLAELILDWDVLDRLNK